MLPEMWKDVWLHDVKAEAIDSKYVHLYDLSVFCPQLQKAEKENKEIFPKAHG